MPSLLKSLALTAAAAAAFVTIPAQAASDCSAQRGCAAKFCEIENDIAAAKAQNNTRREAGLRKALAEAKANCTDSRLQSQREADKVAERESELKQARAKGKQDKIDKAQRKLDEAQAEYNAALVELNR
jgi:membrane-bound lytic murein transglycosylase B